MEIGRSFTISNLAQEKIIYEFKNQQINSLICAFQGFRLKTKFVITMFSERASLTTFTGSKVKL